MFKYIKRIAPVVVMVALPVLSFASGEPLDLSETGTTLAGYVAGAAGAAVGVLAALWGVRVIIRAFRAAIGR